LTGEGEGGGADSASSKRRVGAVVLNWRRPEHILACLQSLLEQTHPICEVVVVDNGSNNGSLDRIRARFPTVTVIENSRNLGFAAGNNIGITHLLRRPVDYLLLMNDDAVAAHDMVESLVAVAEAEADVDILGPTICYQAEPDRVWSAGGTVTTHGLTIHRYLDQPVSAVPADPGDVDYITGCVLLARSSMVQAIGALDERYFAYFEDTEWCARARRAGFRLMHVPQAQAWHDIGVEERAQSPETVYLMTRNRLLYLRQTGAPPTALASVAARQARLAASCMIQARHRDRRPLAKAMLRGLLDFALARFGPPPAGYDLAGPGPRSVPARS